MTQMTTNEIEKCRAVPIHSLLGLRNLGRRVMIKCPFHADRTASMAIYPNNGYHCFGCGKHGNNAVDFVVALGTTFPEAINELKKYT